MNQNKKGPDISGPFTYKSFVLKLQLQRTIDSKQINTH